MQNLHAYLCAIYVFKQLIKVHNPLHVYNTDKAGFINLFIQCRNKKQILKSNQDMTGVISVNLFHCFNRCISWFLFLTSITKETCFSSGLKGPRISKTYLCLYSTNCFREWCCKQNVTNICSPILTLFYLIGYR